LRVKSGGGHAGHNGLRSLHAHVGDAHGRVRPGIGHPGRKVRVAGYVLSDFAKSNAEWPDDLMRGISDGAPHLAKGDANRFMNVVARRTAPPPRDPKGDAAPGSAPPGPLRRLADRFR